MAKRLASFLIALATGPATAHEPGMGVTDTVAHVFFGSHHLPIWLLVLGIVIMLGVAGRRSSR